MSAYDVLAADYDAVTGDAAAEAALVRKIIERRHGRARALLDVACGTGAVTAELARTYQVSGLDVSSGMLAVARAKLPAGTPLYLADMASFELTARFDAIVCAYQGVNHLPGFPAWESFFGRAADHLDSRGVFVFDIATVGYVAAMASVPRVVQRFGDDYLVIRVSMTGPLTSSWRIDVFKCRPDGSYRLVTQTLAMTAFPLARIRDALERRFTDVEAVDAAGEPAGEDAGRVWLACGKRRLPDTALIRSGGGSGCPRKRACWRGPRRGGTRGEPEPASAAHPPRYRTRPGVLRSAPGRVLPPLLRDVPGL